MAQRIVEDRNGKAAGANPSDAVPDVRPERVKRMACEQGSQVTWSEFGGGVCREASRFVRIEEGDCAARADDGTGDASVTPHGPALHCLRHWLGSRAV